MRLLFVFFFVSFFSHAADATIHVDVTGGKVDPLPIAILDFDGTDAKAKEQGKQFTRVITDNLARSGLFKPIDHSAFIHTQEPIHQQPRFQDWQVINAQALVHGHVEVSGDTIRVSFRLWDVFAREQMAGQAFETETDNWRRIAHIISDAIYQRLTGELGYFDTRIVYIAEDGSKRNRRKRLAIMDQDGHNHRYLTDGSYMVLTPRFSPTVQQITYMSYYKNKPRVYLFDIETGKQELLGNFSNMTFASRFSPDGNHIIFSMSQSGNTEIYVMDLHSKEVKKLTFSPGIDTSPSYSPDGNQIVFNSDRGGSQQLYVMDADGSSVHRISYGSGRYATPVWSPRGDYIAFTKMKGGTFYNGVMLPDGSGERLLAKGYLVEGPTWSPNGRVLLYFKETPLNGGTQDRAQIYSVDVTGYNERLIPTPVDASDPSWSPLLP